MLGADVLGHRQPARGAVPRAHGCRHATATSPTASLPPARSASPSPPTSKPSSERGPQSHDSSPETKQPLPEVQLDEVIEGACRYLVKDRMALSGARWRLKGADAVLKLRAIRKNGDWDSYYSFHLAQERKRVHESRYAATSSRWLPERRSRLLQRSCTQVRRSKVLSGHHQDVAERAAGQRKLPRWAANTTPGEQGAPRPKPAPAIFSESHGS